MPHISRYDDDQIEQILTDLIQVLDQHKATTELSLIVLGNMVTHLLNSNVAPAQRTALASSFAEALLSSVYSNKPH